MGITNGRFAKDRMVMSALGSVKMDRGKRVANARRGSWRDQTRRLDEYGVPLVLPPSFRTPAQRRFEEMGNMGGVTKPAGALMDPEIAAAKEKNLNIGGIFNDYGGGAGNFARR